MKGETILNIDFDSSVLSENLSERKRQLEKIVDACLIVHGMMKNKQNSPNKKLTRELKWAESDVRFLTNSILALCKEEVELASMEEEKSNLATEDLNTLKERIEISKIENLSSSWEFLHAVQPFIDRCERSIKAHRKNIVRYKDIADELRLQVIQLEKANSKYQQLFEKAAETPEVFGTDLWTISPTDEIVAKVTESRARIEKNLPAMEENLGAQRKNLSSCRIKCDRISSGIAPKF